jgi:uncharacterized protein involved in exopolysaccharide biosynthesis
MNPAGGRRPPANPMGMTDDSHKSVTQQDLREALAPRAARQPTSLMQAAPVEERAWDWDAELAAGERLELHELRQVVAEQREELERLIAADEAAAAREGELRDALAKLASAGPFGRRRVLGELRSCGLLPPVS